MQFEAMAASIIEGPLLVVMKMRNDYSNIPHNKFRTILHLNLIQINAIHLLQICYMIDDWSYLQGLVVENKIHCQ